MAPRASAQLSNVPPRITQQVDDARVTVLHGNTHPLARPAFDRGAAPASLPMGHILLLLNRSPEQEAALEKLMAQQLDKSSPNFHHWLTPAEFGRQFGPAEQDIRTITLWLESHGFRIDRVSSGRTVIEFSGTAGQVQEAFHTEIHQYGLPDGEQHWANASDPAIPSALAPVVAGVRSLHNFFPRPMSHFTGPFHPVQAAGKARPSPMFTFQSSAPCSVPQTLALTTAVNTCYMVGAYDFATIYNVIGLWNAGIDGTGETIAIVNDSNINIQDVRSFRSLMGLPVKDPNVVIAGGVDPGVQPNGDEGEAILDTEWTGAVAKNAIIDLVIGNSTNTTFGADTAAELVVDTNLAPILSESFGACEAGLGGAGNAFYNSLWQQAAAEGITVLISSGDNGPAGCDPNINQTNPAPQPATVGLNVNGLASTTYNVAVGGTDFNDLNSESTYWSSNNNSTTQESALRYIPETVWNDVCTNPVFIPTYGSTAEQVCNSSAITNFPSNYSGSATLVAVSTGSGGASTVYPKPTWQSALTPNDSARDLPDISLFAGTDTMSASTYYVCQSDLSSPPTPCTLTGANVVIYGAGGTSVSTQVMAGIMALVDQKTLTRQGNANVALYQLAATKTCPSSNPTAGCIFYDVTAGNNMVPCQSSTPNCVVSTPGDAYGILMAGGAPAYSALSGYDLATGLGSVNAANLANATTAWSAPANTPDFTISSTNPVATLSGAPMSFTLDAQNGFNGTLYLSCFNLPSADTCSFSPASPVTINGTTTVSVTVSGTVASLPGRINLPGAASRWAASGKLDLVFSLVGAALLLFGLRVRQRRGNLAFALLAFTLVLLAGCGGGSSSGGGGTANPLSIVLTATTCTNGTVPCANGVTHSMTFTLQ